MCCMRRSISPTRRIIPLSPRSGRAISASRSRHGRSFRVSSMGLRPTMARSRSTCLRQSPAVPQKAPDRRRRGDSVPHQPQAVKAGDLLFISGLMALDRDGLVPSARRGPTPAMVLIRTGGAGGIHHRQYRPAVRSGWHFTRQCRAGCSSSTRISGNSIRCTRYGSASLAVARCRFPQWRCLHRCRYQGPRFWSRLGSTLPDRHKAGRV